MGVLEHQETDGRAGREAHSAAETECRAAVAWKRGAARGRHRHQLARSSEREEVRAMTVEIRPNAWAEEGAGAPNVVSVAEGGRGRLRTQPR